MVQNSRDEGVGLGCAVGLMIPAALAGITADVLRKATAVLAAAEGLVKGERWDWYRKNAREGKARRMTPSLSQFRGMQ